MLISVDEVTNSEYIRIFASSFQIFLRNDYPIFLLMTGLYENIYNLQNDKVLTFLYRAPKLILEPLNYTAIRKQYMDIFSLDIDAAGELASLTKGYPLPFRYLVISTGKIAIKRLWNRFCRNMTNIWMNMYTVKYGRNYPIWIKKS